jgi:hypothetical protein
MPPSSVVEFEASSELLDEEDISLSEAESLDSWLSEADSLDPWLDDSRLLIIDDPP